MQVQTTVDETDVGKISIGQQATFTVDAYPDDKFTGTVSQIRLAPQSIQNVVNYIVLIDVENEQLKLMPGMTASVKILVASATDVLRVPNMALRFQPPTDLIDTTGTGGARGGFGGRNQMGGDSTRGGRNFGGGPGMQGGGGGQQGDMMARFQAMRDSIQAAHGGKLSQEELRTEMQKFFASRMPQRNQSAPLPAVKPKRNASADAAKFGIVSNFPEYEKSVYDPSSQSGRGRVWILKPSGLLEQINVRTGLNDGRYTQITSMRLNPGDQLVLGASSGDPAADQARSPLTGQGQQRPMGGGGFGR
jgi:HlyD family secretion protein